MVFIFGPPCHTCTESAAVILIQYCSRIDLASAVQFDVAIKSFPFASLWGSMAFIGDVPIVFQRNHILSACIIDPERA